MHPVPRAIEPRVNGDAPRRPAVDNASLGMALFVFTEIMLFAAFISAFAIVESGSPVGAWPPPGQPRLPIGQTAVNTVALLASGVALFVATRKFAAGRRREAQRWMAGALGLGTFFVIAQGAEWTGLLREGLTLTSSQMGSFFYLIVGAHALHAVAAILLLGWAWRALAAGRLTGTRLNALAMFWYFVVLVWPALYWKVYL